MSIKSAFARLFRGRSRGNPEITVAELVTRYDGLSNWLEEATQRLEAAEKQIEATRRKVYRDDEPSEAERLISQAKTQVQPPVPQFHAGDPVPPEFMNIFGGN